MTIDMRWLGRLGVAGTWILFSACAADADGDGTPDDLDCAPGDATIHPGAVETAGDGIDSDCDGADDPIDAGDDDDDDDDGTDPGDFDSVATVAGDFTCKDNLPEVTAGDTGDVVLTVLDFEEDEPVAGANVQVWPGNNPQAGAAAAETYMNATGIDGRFTVPSGVLNACEFFAVRVWTEFEPQETYQTYQVNVAVAGTPPYAEDLNSVAFSTYNLLPLTVGVEPEPGKGIAAGRWTDCNGDPVEGGEANVGTLDRTSGAVTQAAGYAMRYFSDESPDGDQMQISADGLFGALNVPPGAEQTLMVWGIPQDEAHCERTTGGDIIWSEANEAMCLLGTSAIVVQPDSVNIANVELRPFPNACYPQGGR